MKPAWFGAGFFFLEAGNAPFTPNARRGPMHLSPRQISEIATALLGRPNEHQSSRDQLRFGSNGSLAVELSGERAGAWYDHEHGMGGGILDLVREKKGLINGEAMEWLHGFGVEREDRRPMPERPPAHAERPQSRIVATYDYHAADGSLLFQVVRKEPKTFLQRRPDPQAPGGWTWKVKGLRVEPYHLPDLLAAAGRKTILIAEGEKDVDALRRLGLPATCNPGGAGKWPAYFSSYFRGARVVILPDNDTAGRDHARMVAASLHPVAESVRVLELPGLPPKGDVSDWIAAGGTRDALVALARDAALWQVPAAPDASTETEPQRAAEPDQKTAVPKPAGQTERSAQPKPSQRSPNWYADCILGSSNQVLPILANALLALRRDPAWDGVLIYDEMVRAPMLIKPVPRHGTTPADASAWAPRPLTDDDVTLAQEWLQIAGLHRLGKDPTHQAIDLVARENAVHPVRAWLEGLVWDGVPRLAGGVSVHGEIIPPWLTAYLGAEDTEYTRAVGTMFLIGMVARVLKPGCQCDYMLVLEGSQGLRKTSACRVLGGDFFSESLPGDVMAKDAQQHLRGKWLIEFGEMHAMSKSEVTAVKSFVTRPVEIYRPSYGRKEIHEPRQCVFIGTTNKDQYLRDETGARRFWPVRVGTDGQPCRTAELALDRAHLFAEAVHRYHAGERWWPDGDFERRCIQPEQDARYEADAWEEAITSFLSGKDRTTVLEVARHGLSIETARVSTADQRRITAIMERMGWRRGARTGRSGTRWWEPAVVGRVH